MKSAARHLAVVPVTAALGMASRPSDADAPPTFGDETSQWHGFDRDDFLMDESTMTIKPYKGCDRRMMSALN